MRDMRWFEGLSPNQDWMEWTMIMGAIALVVIAVALLALAVRVWLDARTGAPTATAETSVNEGETATLDAPTPPAPQGSPRATLDRRYAAGEIDREEYLRRRKDLDKT